MSGVRCGRVRCVRYGAPCRGRGAHGAVRRGSRGPAGGRGAAAGRATGRSGSGGACGRQPSGGGATEHGGDAAQVDCTSLREVRLSLHAVDRKDGGGPVSPRIHIVRRLRPRCGTALRGSPAGAPAGARAARVRTDAVSWLDAVVSVTGTAGGRSPEPRAPPGQLARARRPCRARTARCPSSWPRPLQLQPGGQSRYLPREVDPARGSRPPGRGCLAPGTSSARSLTVSLAGDADRAGDAALEGLAEQRDRRRSPSPGPCPLSSLPPQPTRTPSWAAFVRSLYETRADAGGLVGDGRGVVRADAHVLELCVDRG